jgi:hypothetical protein
LLLLVLKLSMEEGLMIWRETLLAEVVGSRVV